MSTKITYDGKVIHTLEVEQVAALRCSGRVMKTDVAVQTDDKALMSYDGNIIANIEGQTVTLKCGGKLMKSDISIATESAMETLTAPTAEIDGTNLLIYDEEGLATEYDILVDGVVKDTVEVSKTVNITLNADIYTDTTATSSVKVKFGSAPTDAYEDYDYYSASGSSTITDKDGVTTTSVNITVQPVAYIWGAYDCAYKLNGGSLHFVGQSYSTATEVQLSDGDVLTIVSSYD